MAENTKFCTRCGCNVTPTMQFCPECGNVIEGTKASEEQKVFVENMQVMVKESRRNFLFFALGIYAIPAIIFGLIALIDAGNTAHTIFANDDFHSYYVAHHWTFTVGDLQNYITGIAAVELLSGILAAVTMVLVKKGIKRKVAFVCCTLAAVLCFWSIFGMFLGFLMSWEVYAAKDIFSDEAPVEQ